jgi:acid phosphatase (class A)
MFYDVALRRVAITLLCLMTIAACASVEAPIKPAPMAEARQGRLPGYLSPGALPSSLALLRPPPVQGSTAFSLDDEIYRKTRALRDTPRWALAKEDADMGFPQAAAVFSCALNAPITEEDTPHLLILMRRAMSDAVQSTFPAKNHFKRPRPFSVKKEPSCTPDWENRMRDDSYPSGHAALGWAWALILCEIDPEHTDVILSRGLSLGESRVICGVHWQSDVTAGYLVGAATVARLHADPAFRADLEAAKAELAAVRAKGLKPTRDCEAEAATLALQPPSAP